MASKFLPSATRSNVPLLASQCPGLPSPWARRRLARRPGGGRPARAGLAAQLAKKREGCKAKAPGGPRPRPAGAKRCSAQLEGWLEECYWFRTRLDARGKRLWARAFFRSPALQEASKTKIGCYNKVVKRSGFVGVWPKFVAFIFLLG